MKNKKNILIFVVLIIIISITAIALLSKDKDTETSNNSEVNTNTQTNNIKDEQNTESKFVYVENRKDTDMIFSNGNLILSRVAEPQKDYPKGIKVSAKYRVLAKAADDTTPWDSIKNYTATYEAAPDYLDPYTVNERYRENIIHMAQIDAGVKVRLRVELLDDTKIKTLSLNPTRYTEVDKTKSNGDNWIEFEVEPSDLTKSILVQINAPSVIEGPLNNGLMIFVNPISKIPEGNVLKLPSGVINSSSVCSDMNAINAIIIDENSPYDALYIPSDTIIDGRIQIKKENFSIYGRGIVVGSRWKYPKSNADWSKSYPKEISPDGSVLKAIVRGTSTTNVEGIAVVHPYHFCFEGGQTATNLKAFGWRYSSDAYHLHEIYGCFSRVNDDATYINSGVVESSVFYGMNNGTIFQLGWGQAAANGGGGTLVSKCDIVRGEWDRDGGDNENNGVIGGVLGGTTGTIKDVVIQDIRAEGDIMRFITFDMPRHSGTLENFLLKDIYFEKKPFYPNSITNRFEVGGGIYNFTFENVVIGGKKIESLKDIEPIKLGNMNNIIFK